MKPHGVYEYSVDRNGIVKNGFAVGKAALSRNSDNFAVGKSITDTDVKGFKVIIIGIYSVAVINNDRVARRRKIAAENDLACLCGTNRASCILN